MRQAAVRSSCLESEVALWLWLAAALRAKAIFLRFPLVQSFLHICFNTHLFLSRASSLCSARFKSFYVLNAKSKHQGKQAIAPSNVCDRHSFLASASNNCTTIALLSGSSLAEKDALMQYFTTTIDS
jgi:hypothetical protein